MAPANPVRAKVSLGWSWFAVCLWLDGVIVAAAVGLALFEGYRPDVHFAEGGAITYFSSAQLIVLAGLAMELFLLRRGARGDERNRGAWLWLVVSIGMLALAFDEAFAVHEHVDHLIHERFGLTESPLTDRIDDVIVLLYGCIGIGALWIFRSELRFFRKMWPYLVIAFSLFFVMVALDLLTNSYSISPATLRHPVAVARLAAWANVAEDSCKLASEAAFLGAFIAMLCLAKKGDRLTASFRSSEETGAKKSRRRISAAR